MPKEYKITNEILNMLESEDKEMQTLAITLMGYVPRTIQDFHHFHDFLAKHGFHANYTIRTAFTVINAEQITIRKYPNSQNLRNKWKPTGE